MSSRQRSNLLVGDLMQNLSPASSSSLVFDRFIPVRSGMDLHVSRFLLTNKGPANPMEVSPYQRRLAEIALNNRTRILAFHNKPPQPPPTPAPQQKKLPLRRLAMSQELPLDVDGILNDELLKLVDWSKKNVLAVVIENVVYFWDASRRNRSGVIAVEAHAFVTSVSWSPDGRILAAGLNGSDVQLWDVEANRLMRTLPRSHDSLLVGSLAWRSCSGDNNILASGGADANIEIYDVRSDPSHVATFRGHDKEVCRLRWSDSGLRLASGGQDGLVHIWDVSMTSSSNAPSSLRRRRWLHRFDHHKDAVTGLAWCPFKAGVLASGGSAGDMRIALWDAQTGTRLNSFDAGSRVSSLCWNIHEPELLSSHGLPHNQVTLWKYPDMDKTAELVGHKAPILWMVMSPDGCTVASASAEQEVLIFWDLYTSDPKLLQKKVAKREGSGSRPFSSISYIR